MLLHWLRGFFVRVVIVVNYHARASPRPCKSTLSSDVKRRRLLVLKTLKLDPGASVSEIHSAAGLWCTEKTVQRDLSYLIKRGVVRKSGERRWTRYYPK